MIKVYMTVLCLGMLCACKPKASGSKPAQPETKVEASAEGLTTPMLPPPDIVVPAPRSADLQQAIAFQYWLLERRGATLAFNSPWDQEPSAAIVEDPRDPVIQDFTHRCAEAAELKLRQLLALEPNQKAWQAIAAAGGSQQLLIVMNQAPSGTQLYDLLALDRGPDMWFWNQDDKRPQLAFALWNRGAFVYEGAATPESCFAPQDEQLSDFLQYAAKRLSRRKSS